MSWEVTLSIHKDEEKKQYKGIRHYHKPSIAETKIFSTKKSRS